MPRAGLSRAAERCGQLSLALQLPDTGRYPGPPAPHAALSLRGAGSAGVAAAAGTPTQPCRHIPLLGPGCFAPGAPRPAPPAEPSLPPGALGWSGTPCPPSPAFLPPWGMPASVPSCPSTRGKPILHVRFGLVLSASFSSEEESSSSSSSSAEGSASAREETARLNARTQTLPFPRDRSPGGWQGGAGTAPSMARLAVPVAPTLAAMERFAPRGDLRAPRRGSQHGSSCLVPPTPPGWQPRPCGHRAAHASADTSRPRAIVLLQLPLRQRRRGPRLTPSACPLLRAAPQPPSPIQTNRRQPPAAPPRTAAGGTSPRRAGNSSGHP